MSQKTWALIAAHILVPIGLATAQSRVNVDVDVDVEVLTRGPVHEAFVTAVDEEYAPAAAVRVVRPPPPPIDEFPPEQLIEAPGEEVEWVPGYWAFDDERDDYIWVSGVWRTPPPGSNWLPGYWSEGGGGYEYASGAWISDDDDELEYLPQPPQSLERTPIGRAPSPDHLWVAGSWYWEQGYDWNVGAGYDPRLGLRVQVAAPRQGGYVWRPGYWMAVRPGWLWTPAQYVYTPRGHIFVAGYWDYPLERRGVLFAPVHFGRPALTRNVRYSPSVSIDVSILPFHLFTRPHVTHYYFGDYYDDSYVTRGYRPFYERHRDPYHYDPILVSLRLQYAGRDHGRWLDDLRGDYEYRRQHVEARPARSYRDQRARDSGRDYDPRGGRDYEHARKSVTLAQPVEQVVRNDVRVTRLDSARREQFAQRGRDLQSFKERRRSAETSAVAAPEGVRRDDGRRPAASNQRQSQRVKIQRAPVSGRTPEARSRAPQQRPPSPDRSEPRRIRPKRDNDNDRQRSRESEQPRSKRDKDKDDDDDR